MSRKCLKTGIVGTFRHQDCSCKTSHTQPFKLLNYCNCSGTYQTYDSGRLPSAYTGFHADCFFFHRIVFVIRGLRLFMGAEPQSQPRSFSVQLRKSCLGTPMAVSANLFQGQHRKNLSHGYLEVYYMSGCIAGA